MLQINDISSPRIVISLISEFTEEYIPKVLLWEDVNDHPNILRFEEVLHERDHWIIVTEYDSKYCDLFNHLNKVQRMDVLTASIIISQIVDTVLYLHKNGTFNETVLN